MALIDLNNYATFIFDCDGVILNSNKIKTDAFYEVSKCYGVEFGEALKDYHKNNGGISRYKKFEYFLTEILNKDINSNELKKLLDEFASEVKRNLMVCEVTSKLGELRRLTQHGKWLIVSGGDQLELRDVFRSRNMDDYFDGGIYGSPDDKITIMTREIENNNIKLPAIYFGDSKYDYYSSSKVEIDFMFMHKWSEVNDWKKWTIDEDIFSIKDFEHFLT